MKSLEVSLNRSILSIFVAMLHGSVLEVPSVQQAMKLIETYKEPQTVVGFVRYEISVRYSNGDRVEGAFEDKQKALSFLASLMP